MALSSRVRYLENTLSILEYHNSLRALDLVIEEMCAEKGFKRHSGKHYYYHLVDVTLLLLNNGIRDEDTITAALLHDIVEDVDGYTVNTIEKLFNPTVAKYVKRLTKKPHINYKEDKEELQKYLNGCLEFQATSLVKCADRVHNFGTLREATSEKRLRQANETKQYFFPFFKEARIKYPRVSHFFLLAKSSIEPHLYAIHDHNNEVNELQSRIKELENMLEKNK